jgi:hypothetical protein
MSRPTKALCSYIASGAHYFPLHLGSNDHDRRYSPALGRRTRRGGGGCSSLVQSVFCHTSSERSSYRFCGATIAGREAEFSRSNSPVVSGRDRAQRPSEQYAEAHCGCDGCCNAAGPASEGGHRWLIQKDRAGQRGKPPRRMLRAQPAYSLVWPEQFLEHLGRAAVVRFGNANHARSGSTPTIERLG